MKEETKEKLISLVKSSEFAGIDAYFHTRDQYKAIDKIYMSNPKETVDIIYELALEIDKVKSDDNVNRISVLHNLMFSHLRDDDMTYLKSIFRKMVLEIFEKNEYAEFRRMLGSIIRAGFDKKEIKELYEKYLKVETDPEIIIKYKYQLLSIDLYNAFPKHVFDIMNFLELNELKSNTVERAQANIDVDIKNMVPR